MSEFAAILKFVGEVVKFLCELSLDIILTGLLVSSCILPWRLAENCNALSHLESRRGAYRELCCLAFFITILDFFAIPMGLMSLLSPYGWRYLYLASEAQNTSDYINFEIRYALIVSFFMAGWDILLMFISMFGLISPLGRQIHLAKALFIPIDLSTRNVDAYSNSVHTKLAYTAVIGLESIVDFFVVLVSLISFVCPTTWVSVYRACASVWLRRPETTEIVLNIDAWSNLLRDFRRMLLHQIWHALIDVLCTPFLLTSLLSPLRSPSYIRKMSELRTEREEAISRGNFKDIDDGDFSYVMKMRTKTFENGVLAVLDLLMLPLIIPLVITQYRYRPIAKVIAEKKTVGLPEVAMICAQFTLLFVDLILLGLTHPILFITQLRWAPIKKLLQEEDCYVNNTYELYAKTVTQFQLLFLDVLFSPLTLLVLLTQYRSQPLKEIWSTSEIWNDGILFHFAVFGNVLILLHDFLLLPFIVIGSILSPFRGFYMWKIIFADCSSPAQQYHAPNDTEAQTNTNSINATNVTTATTDTPTAPVEEPPLPPGFLSSITLDPIPNEEPQRPNHYVKIFPSWESRCELWGQVCAVVIDIPFAIFAILVLVTMWRAWELCRRVHEATNRNTWLTFKHDMKIRCIIIQQFMLLFVDMIMVLPLLVIMGTVYRFPETGLEMYMKMLGPGIVGDAAFPADVVTTESPNINGPTFTFKVKSTAVNIDITKPMYVRVRSSGLWSEVQRVFGNTVNALIQSMLPLRLNPGTTYAVATEGDDVKFWIRFEIGKVKKASILKKLALLQGTTTMVLQLEGHRVGGTGPEVITKIKFSLSALKAALEEPFGVLATSSIAPADERVDKSDNLVNNFALIVSKGFLKILIDIGYLLMFCTTIVSPYRMWRLLTEIFEPAEFAPLRIAARCLRMIDLLDEHILAYRHGITPILYELAKTKTARNTWMSNHYYMESEDAQFVADLEKSHIYGYQKLAKSLKKYVNSTDGLEDLSKLITKRQDLQQELLTRWFKKFGSYSLLYHKTVDANRYAVVNTILAEEHRSTAADIAKNRSDILNLRSSMEEEANLAYSRSFKKRIGLFNRPLDQTRKIIKDNFIRAWSDVVIMFTIAGILLTVIRALPLIRDVIWRPSPTHSLKRIAKIHMIGALSDLRDIMILIAHLLFLIILVAPIPGFLQDIGFHLGSVKELTKYTKKHINYFLIYLCELFCLVFACRTYVMVFNAVMYSVLVPGACLAESIPTSFGTTAIRFLFGFIAWIAVLAGAIRASLISFNAGDHSQSDLSNSDVYSSESSDRALLGVCAALLGLLAFSVFTASFKPHYKLSEQEATAAPSLSWEYILAVLTGPFEAGQLAAVVMYFFWGRDHTNDLGTDSFSNFIFRWGDRSGSSRGVYIALSLAVAVVLLWGLLVSIAPERDDLTYKNSDAYKVSVTLITRIFPVWIMATLMRSTSCITIGDDSVMTTLTSELCGAHSTWGATASMAFLVFFVITSTIMHADDAAQLQSAQARNQITESNTVKFSPIYAMMSRFSQILVLGASMGGFFAKNSAAPLGPIIAVCIIMALIPLVMKTPVCSAPSVTPLRSAGWLAVLWTAAVCRNRTLTHPNYHFALENTIYGGWGVVFVLAIVVAMVIEYRRGSTYERELEESGLNAALKTLAQTCNAIIEDDRILYNNRTLQISHIDEMITTVKRRMSMHNLAVFLLKLEAMTLPERMSLKFLERRMSWKENVKSLLVNSNMRRDDNNTNTTSYNNNNNNNNNGYNNNSGYQTDLISMESQVAMIDNTTRTLQSLQLLSISINDLCSNVVTHPVATESTRKAIVTVLSRKLPRELCFHVFSYMVMVSPMRDTLALSQADVNAMVDALDRRVYFDSHMPYIESYYKSMPFTNQSMRFGSAFIAERIALIKDTPVSKDTLDM